MKKVILFAAILFSSISIMNVQAQGASPSKTGTAQLTLNLSAVQSIKVDGDVVINYTTADDYLNGKDSGEQGTTLTVVSAGGFVVRVEADDLTGGGNTPIEASSIKVTAAEVSNGGNTNYDTEGTLASVATGTKKPLISATKGGVDKVYKVTYEGADANKYMENFNNAGEGATQSYTTTVTYTIAAS